MGILNTKLEVNVISIFVIFQQKKRINKCHILEHDHVNY